MLSTTGRKEKLPASKGSEIEVSLDWHHHRLGEVWYRAILQENLAAASSKRKKLSVRHLNPLLNEDHSPPVITTAVHRLLRPVPPPLEVGFEEGDMIDAAHKDGWWSGWVIKVMGNGRFLVYLRFEPDVIEVERKDLRPHLVWKDEEWFRCCEEKLLTEKEFSTGTTVEVKKKVEPFGIIWAPAITIKENETGTLLVKYKGFGREGRKTNVSYSKIRPSPPPFGSRAFGLMENVDALLESGWCPSVVTMVLSWNRYAVLLGRNKPCEVFNHSQLRPSVEWSDGAWQTQEEKANEESNNIESVNERQRGQQPQVSASQTPDPMPNVVETPKAKETIMVLPFVKKSPCWQVLESVEILKAVPQHPHFSPLLKCKEALREGEAIRAMINFAKLLGIVGDLQVDASLNDINSINEFFLMLEKYGFDVTAPRAKIEKLLSIKESRTWALEELQVAERVMAEKDNKRRKLED
uniref:Agenet domain-containing protein n=1 Tax=Brassica campestris TaxID=3711 RepID=A0A3P6BGU9_BRACM|nr:unnamed protein product [Brassica rapa]